MKWAGQVAHTGDKVDTHISVGKPMGRRPLGRSRCGRKYNTRFKKNDGEWTGLILFRTGTSGGLFSTR
jgi:hypothetical protein